MNISKSLPIYFCAVCVLISCDQSGNTGARAEGILQEKGEPALVGRDTLKAAPIPRQVSRNDLVLFVAVTHAAQNINFDAQAEMQEAVEQSGLAVDQFNKIAASQEDGGTTYRPTENELDKFNSAVQQIETIQLEAERQMQAIIDTSQLSEDRYKEIGEALRSDPALEAQYRALSEDKMNQ